MGYLNTLLGIHVVYKGDIVRNIPNFIHARYKLQKATLDGNEVIFLFPKTELEPVSAIKKHIERIQKEENLHVILVPKKLTYRKKEYLLRDRIPFIVEGKQIYLPFMGTYLQERSDGEKQMTDVMLPSAQLLFLYYIYNGCGELLTSEAAKALELTPTSISRASIQLEGMGLIKTEKRGVQKVVFSNKTVQELFTEGQKHLANPVKRRVYVPKSEIKERLLFSGYSALSNYSMLNPSDIDFYATDSIARWEKIASKKLLNEDEQCAVEFWSYNPRKLSKDENVDRLSLALSLREDKDERVEEAVQEMLEQVWRDIDDKRN
ncbi:MAG: hypothetical protein BWX78_01734 [Firmicutes bacterium ADurb.Bin099]|nr:MAG: hypothetical protein BWX78_01734 [Firmicutes bacterium ADurb.Bin099]